MEVFRREGRDLILVDTSGRHKQQEALFEEMRAVAAAVNPDLVVFVMDGSIGQAAQEQAQAFRESVAVGGIIMTKMDGHAKGGGALSAVAATQSPILFIGTGEHMDQFEPFDSRVGLSRVSGPVLLSTLDHQAHHLTGGVAVRLGPRSDSPCCRSKGCAAREPLPAQSFVGKLLNMGDIKGLVERINEVVPEDMQPEMMDKLLEGNFTLRMMREQYVSMLKLGPMSQVVGMIPGLGGLASAANDQMGSARIKKFMVIMDSMTAKELDCSDAKVLMQDSRIIRVARGSGVHPQHVVEMIEEFKRISAMMKSVKASPGCRRLCTAPRAHRPANQPTLLFSAGPQVVEEGRPQHAPDAAAGEQVCGDDAAQLAAGHGGCRGPAEPDEADAGELSLLLPCCFPLAYDSSYLAETRPKDASEDDGWNEGNDGMM